MTNFTELGLAAPLLKALSAANYTVPTPIQAQAIPHVLAGKDLLGIAQTGTGKTAAFALPILQALNADRRRPERNSCRALILSPTRELASQIAESFRSYGAHMGLGVATVFGGVSIRPQIDRLSRGVDILVATPGRLLDHVDQRTLRLDKVQIFVLDEADQMMDMGFIHALRRIVPLLPNQRQSLFFSATMPREIGALAGDLLRDPVKVAVTPVATTAERIDQRAFFVETARKRQVLADVVRSGDVVRALVFTRTKHGADKVVRHLGEDGIAAVAIHGNKSQGQRERALAAFKNGDTRILVATDIAARGIDVEAVSHVVNFDVPNVPDTYVHRIGRTARAGAEGQAISLVDGEERAYLRAIEKLTRQSIPTEDRRDPNARPTVGSDASAGRPHAGANRPLGQTKRPFGDKRAHGDGNRPHGASGRPARPGAGRREDGRGATRPFTPGSDNRGPSGATRQSRPPKRRRPFPGTVQERSAPREA